MKEILGKKPENETRNDGGEWLGFWSKRTQERARKLEQGLVEEMSRKKALFAKSRLREFKREQSLRPPPKKKKRHFPQTIA